MATKTKTKTGRSNRPPARQVLPEEVFPIDEEAQAFAEEFIAEATSAEYVAEEARNEAYEEEERPLYDADFADLDGG